MTTLLEYTLLFIVLGVMLVLWPSVASYPLPAFFNSTVAQLASTTKFLMDLPILDHFFWWIFMYIRLFLAHYIFKFLLHLLSLIPGRDRSIKL